METNDSKAVSKAGITVCYFFHKLPRELRDKIYADAYTFDFAVTVQFPYVLEGKFTSVGTPKVYEKLLVNKQFYSEGIPIAIRAGRFKCDGMSLELLIGCFPLFRDNITSIELDWSHGLEVNIGDILTDCTALRNLCFQIDFPDLLLILRSGRPEMPVAFANLKAVHGLKSFTFELSAGSEVTARATQLKSFMGYEEKVGEVEGKIAELEKEIVACVTKPRE